MYKSGSQDGPYTDWWPNGQLKRKGIFKADKREGHLEYRNEDGTPNIKRTGTYQMGVRIEA